jgi:predicted transposase/invertase (TIGR01784 family)
MQFINPKTDFAFKKIFGSDQSKEVLLSFLNALLYNGEAIIEDLTLINPYQAPRISGIKSTYLDVKARLSSGEGVIIEMQVLNVAGFQKRILYNAAKAYSMQLADGQPYSLLNPVIALTITDFVMFEEVMFEEADLGISRFVLKEKQQLFDYPSHDLELVFVELPKFNLQLDQLKTLAEKWIYFLRYAPNLSTVPEPFSEISAFQQAFSFANRGLLTPQEIDEQDQELFFITDQRAQISQALQQGEERGLARGSAKTQEVIESIARQLLDTLDDAAIAKITGLEVSQVRSLREP